MEITAKDSILVVDDEAFIRDLIGMMVLTLGYRVTPARNAIEALDWIKNNDGFQMVLTDINMPQTDGWELALRIKALKPGLPIVAVTGESPNKVIPKLKGSGISQALFKPFSMDLLRDTIAQTLEFERDALPTGQPDGREKRHAYR